jgi:hypothetical protein
MILIIIIIIIAIFIIILFIQKIHILSNLNLNYFLHEEKYFCLKPIN